MDATPEVSSANPNLDKKRSPDVLVIQHLEVDSEAEEQLPPLPRTKYFLVLLTLSLVLPVK